MGAQSAKSKQDKTIRRILDSAAQIFAESGFEGARMDKIAKQAQINKATIYYHIGNKNALYARVLHNMIGNATEYFMSALQDNKSPEEKIKTYIGSIAHTMEQNPYLAPIMMREQASGGRNLPEIIAGDFALIISIVTKILEEGAEQGVFIKTTAFVIHSMVIGGIMFYQSSYPVRSGYAVFPENVKSLDDRVSGEVASEIEKLILKAVKK